jgi:hypothetical protein
LEGTTLTELWAQLIGTQPAPRLRVVLLTGGLALLCVVVDRIWRTARHLVTLVHEGGHALVALLTGRRLAGIRLHSDTSGLTVSVGRPTGPGMVCTTLAGYLAPPVVGLACVGLLSLGRLTLMLWVGLALLLGMLVLIRNAFGVVSIVTTGVVLFAVSWFGTPTVQAAFGSALTWFLLLGGIRPVIELQRKRARRRARDSDADQLGRLTGVPAVVWVLLFGVAAVAAFGLGVWTLVPDVADWITDTLDGWRPT